MIPHDDTTTEIFAIWEYDSYEKYKEIEGNVKGDQEHVSRVNAWYEKYGGRDYVIKNYLLKVRNEQLETTLSEVWRKYCVLIWKIRFREYPPCSLQVISYF